MNFRNMNWLKKLNASTTPKTTIVPRVTNPSVTPPINPISKSLQQMSGQVGGIQTTALQTQPLAAQLSWFNPSPGQQNLQPANAILSWLGPYLNSEIAKRLPSLSPTWTQNLPQNITKELLKKGVRRQ